MQPLRLLGWGLLAAAFVAAAAETAAQGVTRDWGSMSAADLARVFVPGIFDAFRDGIDEMLHPLVWDYAVQPLLALPAWLLIGVPGVALVWRFREIDDSAEANMDRYPQTTYEEIVAAAHEADEQDIGIPSKYRDLAEYDPTQLPASDESGNDPALDPLHLDQADVVPPARHIPGIAGDDGGGQSGAGGLNRPF